MKFNISPVCFVFFVSFSYAESVNANVPVETVEVIEGLHSSSRYLPIDSNACDNSWLDPILGIPFINITSASDKPVIIAVIDDGFRLTHEDISPFIYANPEDEINSFDDDANGFEDDFTGWDIADNDADVYPPKDKLDKYYHGTYLSGIIAELLTLCYGEKAFEYFKILPVKAVADRSPQTYVIDGFKGIEYAISMNVDIILCAWGSNRLTAEEKQILKKAKDAGITVIGSAGNFSNNMDYYPAAAEGVIAVNAIDASSRRLGTSNYGQFVDVSAAGDNICGASTANDTGSVVQQGTSPAAAIVTAAAAIIRLHFPKADPIEVEEILKGTAIPIDHQNPGYIGQMGAGAISLKNIATFIESERDVSSLFSSAKQKGIISFSNNKTSAKSWAIKPHGANLGIEVTLEKVDGEIRNGAFTFETPDHDPIKINMAEWQRRRTLHIDAQEMVIQFLPNDESKKFKGKISYEAVPIDSSILYCRETEYFTALMDTLHDGSGGNSYSNNSACKWQITVPEGFRVSMEFHHFSTEPKADNVFIFDGEYPIPKNAIARFSGPDIPPPVVSRSNKVLVWFVTDDKVSTDGWTLIYRAVK